MPIITCYWKPWHRVLWLVWSLFHPWFCISLLAKAVHSLLSFCFSKYSPAHISSFSWSLPQSALLSSGSWPSLCLPYPDYINSYRRNLAVRKERQHCILGDACMEREIGLGQGMRVFSSVFSSFAQSCLTLCDPMNCSTPGFPVHHQLLELTQTHVHWVDAIQPSHPLSSPSPPILSLSQNQGLFTGVSSSRQVAKVLEFQLQHQSFQWTFQDWFLIQDKSGAHRGVT